MCLVPKLEFMRVNTKSLKFSLCSLITIHKEWCPRVRNSCIISRGHRIKNGLEDGFCKKYIKLYKIKMTKKLGGDQIK
jgi:hypothetical protein